MVKDTFNKLFSLTERSDLEQKEEVRDLPLDQIVPNPFQPRTMFNDEKIEELAQTIRTHGIIQPIVVRKKDDLYEIIAGERRFRAAKTIDMKTIPAIVRDLNDTQTASIALIENLQREGLTAIEEAWAYQKLIELHGLTQESLAQRLGKGQSTVANKLRLLQLPEKVQQSLLQRLLTERHARALLSLTDPSMQESLLKQIIDDGLNVKQTEEQIKIILGSTNKPTKHKPQRISYSKDIRLALNTIRESVKMVNQSGLAIQTQETEHEDYYEVRIKIPKNN